MTRPNLPTLRSVATDPSVLVSLPLDALDALLTEADAETKIVGAAKKAITACLETRFASDIAAAYAGAGKDFGAVRVPDGEYEVLVDRAKKVEWDQAALADIRERIQSSGDNPSEFIKTTYAVDERAYSAWPKAIRKTFEPARTVKPGTVSVKLVRKEAA
jgi:hypothetical protein